eukprot:5660538-Prymnesium_polylepis.1
MLLRPGPTKTKSHRPTPGSLPALSHRRALSLAAAGSMRPSCVRTSSSRATCSGRCRLLSPTTTTDRAARVAARSR